MAHLCPPPALAPRPVLPRPETFRHPGRQQPLRNNHVRLTRRIVVLFRPQETRLGAQERTLLLIAPKYEYGSTTPLSQLALGSSRALRILTPPGTPPYTGQHHGFALRDPELSLQLQFFHYAWRSVAHRRQRCEIGRAH